MATLAAAAGMEIHTVDDVIAALRSRAEYFHSVGCRVSDLCGICSSFLKEGAMIVYYKHKERKDIYICRIN